MYGTVESYTGKSERSLASSAVLAAMPRETREQIEAADKELVEKRSLGPYFLAAKTLDMMGEWSTLLAVRKPSDRRLPLAAPPRAAHRAPRAHVTVFRGTGLASRLAQESGQAHYRMGLHSVTNEGLSLNILH